MNDTIKNWLEGKQDYEEGLALLEEYGNNPTMLKQLQKGRRFNNRPYLFAELKKLGKTNVTASRAKQSVTSFRKPVTKRPAPKKVRVNKELEEVVAYRKKKFVEMAKLRNSMADLQTDEERAKAVDEVKSLKELNDRLFEETGHYEKYGRWKNGISPLDTDDARKNVPQKQKPDTEKIIAQADWEKLRKRISRAEKALLKLEAIDGKESTKYIKKQKDLYEMLAQKDELHKKMGK